MSRRDIRLVKKCARKKKACLWVRNKTPRVFVWRTYGSQKFRETIYSTKLLPLTGQGKKSFTRRSKNGTGGCCFRNSTPRTANIQIRGKKSRTWKDIDRKSSNGCLVELQSTLSPEELLCKNINF